MRLNVQATFELAVDSQAEADNLLRRLADDPRVLSLDYTKQERVLVPVRNESMADFGL